MSGHAWMQSAMRGWQDECAWAEAEPQKVQIEQDTLQTEIAKRGQRPCQQPEPDALVEPAGDGPGVDHETCDEAAHAATGDAEA